MLEVWYCLAFDWLRVFEWRLNCISFKLRNEKIIKWKLLIQLKNFSVFQILSVTDIKISGYVRRDQFYLLADLCFYGYWIVKNGLVKYWRIDELWSNGYWFLYVWPVLSKVNLIFSMKNVLYRHGMVWQHLNRCVYIMYGTRNCVHHPYGGNNTMGRQRQMDKSPLKKISHGIFLTLVIVSGLVCLRSLVNRWWFVAI